MQGDSVDAPGRDTRREGGAVRGGDALPDSLLARWRAASGGAGAVAAFPLKIGERTIGCLSLIAADASALDGPERGLLDEFAVDVGYSLGRLRDGPRAMTGQPSVDRTVVDDPLTGLPNRAAMRGRITAAISSATNSRGLAILSVHVGHFDEISDTLGRDAGDRLMSEVAVRVAAVARSGQDALARIGEDELVVLLQDADTTHASDVARRVIEALYRPVDVSGMQVDARGTVGIALYPDHGDDADELMRRAKVAMYRAGADGYYALYSGLHDDERRRRLALIDDLRRAIDADELLLYCQPKVDLRTGRCCGAEALMRWKHARHGMISPTVFVELAETTGLITPLTQWVLEAAFRARQRWHEARFDQPLAVNVSARDLHDPRLVDRVRALMSAWGIREGWMQFELTESALMIEPATVIDTLRRLRDLGIELMVDDYGTGYSSLRYLQQMPVSSIKIDQSFVRMMVDDAESAAIVHSTVELCHALHLRAVAEGVEEVAVYDALAGIGCDAVQGYYVGRPLPVADFPHWAKTSRWAPAHASVPTS